MPEASRPERSAAAVQKKVSERPTRAEAGIRKRDSRFGMHPPPFLKTEGRPLRKSRLSFLFLTPMVSYPEITGRFPYALSFAPFSLAGTGGSLF